MKTEDIKDWLVRNGGPSIKYRTLVDIKNEQDIGLVAPALKSMAQSSPVRDWLGRLRPDFGFDAIHSGNPDAYENVMGKLVMLGMRAGIQKFDSKTLPFRVWLTENTASTEPHSVFFQTVIASFLSYAGYGDTSPVVNTLEERLNALYSFAKDPDIDSIYVDKSQFKGIPKAPSYQRAKLVNPELYPDQQFALPWLHDIRGIAFCDEIMEYRGTRKKVEDVIKIILTDEYQSLPWGYGMAKYGNRYYMIGWSVKIPGFGSRPEKREFAEFILSLEMLAPFEFVQKSTWFRESLDYLEEFRTERGAYLFPRSWIPERKIGYWVGGLHMGLEENRRTKTAIELESTFWALRIKQLAGLL